MKFDGNGTTIQFTTDGTTGADLIGVNTITLPGDSIAVIDATTLENTNVKTAIAAKLKAINDLSFNLDLANIAALPEKGARTQAIITFPAGVGTWSGWGFISSVSDATIANDGSPSVDITFTLGNLDLEGNEASPSLSVNAPDGQ